MALIKPKNVVGKKCTTKRTKRSKVDIILPGLVVVDTLKNQWKIDRLLGSGGFGKVFSTECVEPAKGKLERFGCSFAVKMEPISSGPLFTEIAFYQRVCQLEQIQEFSKKRRLKHLALPSYVTSGVNTIESVQYRFLVLPRLGSDVESIWQHLSCKFHPDTICHIALKMMDALEFIHSYGYAHADVKASNILADFNLPSKCGKIYLTDFGLVSQFRESSSPFKHKPYKELAKYKHNGTIELTSCDAHRGAPPSRRGDLEILGFMLLRLFISKLPWESCLKAPASVAQQKLSFSQDPESSLKACIVSKSANSNRVSSALKEYFLAVFAYDYEEEPDYNSLRKILCSMTSLKSVKGNPSNVSFKGIS